MRALLCNGTPLAMTSVNVHVKAKGHSVWRLHKKGRTDSRGYFNYRKGKVNEDGEVKTFGIHLISKSYGSLEVLVDNETVIPEK